MVDIVEKPNLVSNVSFDEMKTEFMAMDQEIKEKSLQIEQLKEALHKAEVRLAEREDACSKMVDQIEELHENLAELDARFERSEEHNKRLIEEKEVLTKDMEKEVKNIKNSLVATERRYCSKIDELSKEIVLITKQNDYVIREKVEEISQITRKKESGEIELNETKSELSHVKTEYEDYKNEANNKIENLRTTFKQSIETTKQPLTSYLEKNKGSKIPLKKTKGYRVLKAAENDLKNLLVTTTNNNL